MACNIGLGPEWVIPWEIPDEVVNKLAESGEE
jgi:hypothetical protein